MGRLVELQFFVLCVSFCYYMTVHFFQEPWHLMRENIQKIETGVIHKESEPVRTTSVFKEEDVFQQINVTDGDNGEMVCVFNNATQEFLESKVEDVTQNFFFVSSVGAQSIGKSTFYNFLFGTNFEVLSANATIEEMTTTGITLSTVAKQRLVIIDPQGLDNNDLTTDTERNIDKKIALYAFVNAKVVFFHLNELDVKKRPTIDLFRKVLKGYLEMYDKNEKLEFLFKPKKIYFLVHRFPNREAKFKSDDIKNEVTMRFTEVWEEVCGDCAISDLFTLSVDYFHHLDWSYQNYRSEVDQFREKLFNEMDKETDTVNLSNLPLILKFSWEEVRSNRYTNQPSFEYYVSTGCVKQIVSESKNRIQTIIDTYDIYPNETTIEDVLMIINNECDVRSLVGDDFEDIIADLRDYVLEKKRLDPKEYIFDFLLFGYILLCFLVGRAIIACAQIPAFGNWSFFLNVPIIGRRIYCILHYIANSVGNCVYLFCFMILAHLDEVRPFIVIGRVFLNSKCASAYHYLTENFDVFHYYGINTIFSMILKSFRSLDGVFLVDTLFGFKHNIWTHPNENNEHIQMLVFVGLILMFAIWKLFWYLVKVMKEEKKETDIHKIVGETSDKPRSDQSSDSNVREDRKKKNRWSGELVYTKKKKKKKKGRKFKRK